MPTTAANGEKSLQDLFQKLLKRSRLGDFIPPLGLNELLKH